MILVTGATGYVGGRLVTRLVEEGHCVRVLGRDAARLQGRSWSNQVEIVEGALQDSKTLSRAMDGVTVAYYMIGRTKTLAQLPQREIDAAYGFGAAARSANIDQIIYLGNVWLGEDNCPDTDPNCHPISDAMRESGIPVTDFRTEAIIGSGSTLFEMVRYMTERLPVVALPKWSQTHMRPIAIRNVLDFLVGALNTTSSKGEMLEIGGSERLTYAQMLQVFAKFRGHRRYYFNAPWLTPKLSAQWLQWVTPVTANVSLPVIEGMSREYPLDDTKAKSMFPYIDVFDFATAIDLAFLKLDAGEVETSWRDALYPSQGDNKPVRLFSSEGMILEKRQQVVKAPPERVFATFSRLGGEFGWLYFGWAWKIRGAFDRLIGGVGLRRGRRTPEDLRVGDAVDFWRVEAIETGSSLRLRAEMKVPGKAWLEFKALPLKDGRTNLSQTAYFAPKGISGLAYWYLLYPIHALIFSGLIRKLGKLSESNS